MVVWTIAIDLIEDVRGSIAMFMFIIEEATQCVNMACYIAKEAEDMEKASEIAQWAIENLIDPALDFVQTYGILAYPLHIAYEKFFESAKKTLEQYL